MSCMFQKEWSFLSSCFEKLEVWLVFWRPFRVIWIGWRTSLQSVRCTPCYSRGSLVRIPPIVRICWGQGVCGQLSFLSCFWCGVPRETPRQGSPLLRTHAWHHANTLLPQKRSPPKHARDVPYPHRSRHKQPLEWRPHYISQRNLWHPPKEPPP